MVEEKKDKAEKDLDLASDCEWVRALDANGKSIRIAKADLVELIRANMPVATSDINGLMSKTGFFHRRINSRNLADLESGIYPLDLDEGGNNIPEIGINYGVLLVFEAIGYYKVYIAFSHDLGIAKMKTGDSDWKQISFT